MSEQIINIRQEGAEQNVQVESSRFAPGIPVGVQPSVLHGIDGVSPIATVEQTDEGAIISITDRDGTTTAIILNGQDGAPGEPGPQGERGPQGQQGVQGIQGDPGPAGQNGKDGKDGKDGEDGKDGANGADGFSPTATVSRSGDTATITITDKNGTTTATVKDGSDATVTVDSALSPTSTNPVQNKVIYDAIGNVESILQTLNNGGGAS